jgi:hypothetical protein
MARFNFGRKLAHEIHDIDAEGVALHPHQHRRLVLFGLLIFALTLGAGFMLFQNDRDSQENLLKKFGAHPMSAAELRTEMSTLKLPFKPYWLGAMTGLTYEADTSESNEVLIRYIRPAKDASLSGTNLYAVETYENESTYSKDITERDFATDSEFTTNGRTVRYQSKTMAYLTVHISGTTEVFEIHCSQPQTMIQLEKLATALTLIS